MLHLLKNSCKWKLRSFVCVFWPLVFPLILGTFFYIALGNIGKAETMEPVPAAVVLEEDTPEANYFKEFLDSVSTGDTPILKPQILSRNEAQKALEDKEVDGIFVVSTTPSLQVSQSGIQASILETILNQYTSHAALVKDTIASHPENLQQVMEAMKQDYVCMENVSLGGTSLDITTQFFYALIAMACLYGGYIGLSASMGLQANISPLGARRCITPTHKMKLILSEAISSFSIHMVNILILLAVLKYAYQVELGGNTWLTLLIAAFGVLIGVSFGIFVGAAFRFSEGAKVGIITGFSMLGSFCAGLMDQHVKHSLDTAVPFLNRINPAAVITDALYCVHIYDDPGRMAENLIILGVMSLVLVSASFFVTRRQRYAGI